MRVEELKPHVNDDAALEDLFENGTVGLHLVASDGTILRANRADYEMLGYSSDEYVGQPISKFHADADVLADILSRLSRGERLDKYPARLRAKDGSIRNVLVSSSVCFRDGEFINTRCFTIDVTDRVEAEAALHEAQKRLAVTFDTMLAGVAETDAEGRFRRVNEAFVELTGRSQEELLATTVFDITHPEDVVSDRSHYQKQVRGELDSYVIEKRYVHSSGRVIWVQVSSSTVRTAGGDFAHGVRMVQDITERKLAEEHRKLLLAELNHRVKNTLATVQALAAHTARGATSAEDFRQRFEPRLLALSAAHDRLTKNDWRGADLAQIVDEELRAHASKPGAIQIDGPSIMLPARISLSVSMALHELATNALKYGALSGAGEVRVRWSIARESESPYPKALELTWEECGGPPVEPPGHEGFGSRLLRVTAAELRGEALTEWPPEGLLWRISFPLEKRDFDWVG